MAKGSLLSRYWRFICGFLLLLMNTAYAENSHPLVVLYPEVRQPYAKLFDDIMNGVEKGYGGDIQRVGIKKGESAWLKVSDRQIPVMVALGQQLANDLSKTAIHVPLVCGAVGAPVENAFGLTLVPDPAAIALLLPDLLYWVRDIHVVASAEENAGLDVVKDQLAKAGKQLVIHQVADLRQAATIYNELANSLGDKNALWLLPSGSFASDALMSMLLKSAWKRQFAVFSSSPGHVGRGALFSIYANNYQMGVSLGLIAREVESGKRTQPGMAPLRDLFVAVNERTARHLGMNLDDRLKAKVDLVVSVR